MKPALPWQTELLNKLCERWQAGQLPHALLFTGAEGIGKNHFALQFSELLFCDTAKTSQACQPCGQCQGCKLLGAGSHPDFRLVQSEEGKAIPIDTIRSVSAYLTMKSQLSSMQVVIISPADKLNNYAANSLLKTLEEPTPDTLLILVTDRPERLLPTIRSRCQLVPFQKPATDQALAWLSQQCQTQGIKQNQATLERSLDLAGGAPFMALDFAVTDVLAAHDRMLDSFEKLADQQLDPVSEAGRWSETGVTRSIKWLIKWTMEMIRLKSGAVLADNSDDVAIDKTGSGYRSRLKKLSERMDQQRLFAYLDKLTESSRLLDSQVNQQLMMEDLLIGWSRLGRVG